MSTSWRPPRDAHPVASRPRGQDPLRAATGHRIGRRASTTRCRGRAHRRARAATSRGDTRPLWLPSPPHRLATRMTEKDASTISRGRARGHRSRGTRRRTRSEQIRSAAGARRPRLTPLWLRCECCRQHFVDHILLSATSSVNKLCHICGGGKMTETHRGRTDSHDHDVARAAGGHPPLRR